MTNSTPGSSPRAVRIFGAARALPIPALIVPGLLVLALLTSGCEQERADAYGNFEATEVTVSAEASGRLVSYRVKEGMELARDARVGLIDTTSRALQRGELRARRRTARNRIREAERRIDVIAANLETAREELDRDRSLEADQAATARQVNLRQGEVRRLEQELEAARARVVTARSEIDAINAKIAQVDQQITDSYVRNVRSGRVLTNFVERGEFVRPGQPLYAIASLDTLTLRAYVSEAQLSDVRLGQSVTVRYDVAPDSMASRRGTVRHVASEAQFTPTPIQTRENRVDLVYAIEVEVPNPSGALKIGMPGEVAIPGSTDFEPTSR